MPGFLVYKKSGKLNISSIVKVFKNLQKRKKEKVKHGCKINVFSLVKYFKTSNFTGKHRRKKIILFFV